MLLARLLGRLLSNVAIISLCKVIRVTYLGKLLLGLLGWDLVEVTLRSTVPPWQNDKLLLGDRAFILTLLQYLGLASPLRCLHLEVGARAVRPF